MFIKNNLCILLTKSKKKGERRSPFFKLRNLFQNQTGIRSTESK